MKIKFIRADATFPEKVAPGTCIIAHVCNDIGRWGKGFVMAISMRWKQPKQEFLRWHATGRCELGQVQFVKVEDRIIVANMIGQRDIRRRNHLPPVRYSAIHSALERVALEALRLKASVHMPRIGCGLAGGSWQRIEPLIEGTLLASGVPTYVYDKPH